jgi:hypothetical protein
MHYTLDIDFVSLVQYAVQEIRTRIPTGGTAPDIAALDMAIEAARSMGFYREAAFILMMRVGITNFTAEEADEMFSCLLKTQAVASMIHEWAAVQGVPMSPVGTGDDPAPDRDVDGSGV